MHKRKHNIRALLAVSLTLSAGGTALAMNAAHGSAPQQSSVSSKKPGACAGVPAPGRGLPTPGRAGSEPDTPSAVDPATPAAPDTPAAPAEPGAPAEPAAPSTPAEPTAPDAGATAEASPEAGASTGVGAEPGAEAGYKADPGVPEPTNGAAGAEGTSPPGANGDATQPTEPAPPADGSASPNCRGNEGKPAAIVSMGDSFISGEGGRWAGNGSYWGQNSGSVLGTDRAAMNCNASESSCTQDVARIYGDTADNCDRSDVAEIKGADIDGIPPDRRFNIACSGAETRHVISESFKGEKPQTEQLAKIASSNNVKAIALSIGGNDLKFADILESCAKQFLNPVGGPCKGDQEPNFSGSLQRMKTGVASSVDAIRKVMRDAGYDDGAYTLVLQSYPNPLPAADQIRSTSESYRRYTRDGFPFYNADSNWAHKSVVPRISATLRALAKSKDAVFLDLADAFAGHELGAKTSQLAAKDNTSAKPLTGDRAEWIRWIPFLLKVGVTQGSKQEAVHPNAYGQKALSRCLTETVRQHTGGQSEFSCKAAGGGGPETVQVSAGGSGSVSTPGGGAD